MTTTATVIPTLAESAAPKMAEGYCEPRWYAAYTRANQEKRVSEQLGVGSVEHFLPCYIKHNKNLASGISDRD
jgi:hypothetical protein